MEDIINRIRQARDKFIEYHERGEKDKHYHRPNSVYHLWSLENEDFSQMDFQLFDIWARVADDFPSGWEYDKILVQFQLMEKYVPLWAFT